jgi:dihydrofolate reductase
VTPSLRASVFVGTSLDGFLARRGGAFDFLPEGGGEEHGYTEFMASVDTLVIGRNTYDVVLGFDRWPYSGKRVVVLSSRPIPAPRDAGARVERMEGEPRDIAERLAATGSRHAYVDGGLTVQAFLRAGLIQRLTVTRVPVLIGDGIPLFGPLPRDMRLRHLGTRSYPSGLVTSEYEVIGSGESAPAAG